jgi:hypothetical protein
LHAWKFIEDSELEDVIEYSFYCWTDNRSWFITKEYDV